MSQHPWLASYQEDVPHTIDPDRFASLTALLDDAIHRFASRSAFKNFGVSLTYQQMDVMSRKVAAFFQKKWRLAPGDRLGIMLPNLLQYPVVLFGALRAGLVVVNINPLYTAQELTHVLQDAQAKALVILENFAHAAEEALPKTAVKHVVVCTVGDMLGWKGPVMNAVLRYVKRVVPSHHIPEAMPFKQLLSLSAQEHQAVTTRNTDLALLQYTGGTTGVSKGAELTHRNLVANVLQATAWLRPLDLSQPTGSIVTALPLYHIFSFTANCLSFLHLGLCNLLITNPKDIKSFVRTLRKEPFMAMTGVNTLFNALLNNADFCRLNFSRFKVALGGGMAVQSVVAQRFREVTGVPLLEAYGLTEASPAVCINPLNIDEFNHSIGLPIPSTEVCIKNEAGTLLPEGEIGELCVKGPQVMRGYWKRPDETAKVLDAEGWLHTGDMARMDAKGFVYIVDRIKDMILISGFNVYPNEVEEVLARMTGLKEVAVVGVPHPTTGERVVAFVVKRDQAITEKEVIAHCRTSLTNYKVPKSIYFKDELPKTNVGKVLRRSLRDEWIKNNEGS